MGETVDITKVEKELESIRNLLILIALKQKAKVKEIAKASKISDKTISKLFPQKTKGDR